MRSLNLLRAKHSGKPVGEKGAYTIPGNTSLNDRSLAVAAPQRLANIETPF